MLGLVIAVRAINFCLSELLSDTILKNTLSRNVTVWTNSFTILHWLRNPVKQDIFVKNRLKEICQCPNLYCHYVCTSDNPADLASRGCSFDELFQNYSW